MLVALLSFEHLCICVFATIVYCVFCVFVYAHSLPSVDWHPLLFSVELDTTTSVLLAVQNSSMGDLTISREKIEKN